MKNMQHVPDKGNTRKGHMYDKREVIESKFALLIRANRTGLGRSSAANVVP